jgi:hypothetical protein
LSSDKIVIEIDRDIYRLCLICVAVLYLPVFFLFILPLTFRVLPLVTVFVTWPLIVIVMLYCFSRWKSEPSTDTDLLRNQSELVFEE